MPRAQVQTLVGELRSHKPQGPAKKNVELRVVVTWAGGRGKWGDVGQRVQTTGYKIDKFLGV